MSKEYADIELTYEVKHNNLFGIKTESARQRILTEIKRRSKVVPPGFWDYYEVSGSEQRNLLLFFIALKSYDLAMDFHLEVVMQKWKKLEKKLETMDLTMRMDELSSMYEDPYAHLKIKEKTVLTNITQLLTESSQHPQINGRLQDVLDWASSSIKGEKLVEIYGIEIEYGLLTDGMAWVILNSQIESLDFNPQSVIKKLESLLLAHDLEDAIDNTIGFVIHLANMIANINSVPTYKLNT